MSLVLTALCAAVLSAPQGPATPAPRDPEQTEAGRQHYLGRRVAHTMHWTGAAWLMRETREVEENGARLREWLAIEPGQAVCDLGCGNGYHTLPLAEAVGANGQIYAVDLQPQMLNLLRQRAEPRGLANLRFVEAEVWDPNLPAASCDVVLMVDVYHELSHPVRVMTHVRRALKPGGRVVLVEFRAEDPDVPIKPEHMMSKAQVVREMASHGFALADQCDELPWQHAMAFHAADAPGPDFAAEQLLRAFLLAARGDDVRIVAPFLAAGLAADELPDLPADCRYELRNGPDGETLAELQTAAGQPLTHGHSEVVLQRDDAGRWHVAAIRARAPPKPARR
ncbi:MAG: class I SAM-dependent methyltransferase [Planctomycetota bacterium]